MSDGRTLEQIVQQAIGECAGYVSLCWEPKPTGVFDSTTAVAAVDAAVERVMAEVNAVITAAKQRGYENGCIHGAAKYPDIYRDGVKAARDAVDAIPTSAFDVGIVGKDDALAAIDGVEKP